MIVFVHGNRLVYEPLVADETEPTMRALSALLTDSGFGVTDVRIEDLSSARIGSVVAERAP